MRNAVCVWHPHHQNTFFGCWFSFLFFARRVTSGKGLKQKSEFFGCWFSPPMDGTKTEKVGCTKMYGK